MGRRALTFQDLPRLFRGSAGENFGNVGADLSVTARDLLPTDDTDAQAVP